MQKFSVIFKYPTHFINKSCRSLHFLRKEYLGEYLPKVDEKHLESHRTNKFTKYSEIDKLEDYEISEEIPDEKINRLYPELFNYVPLPQMRDSLRERIERREMMKRRKHLDIPEFYAGSIMAITTSDPFMSNKLNRFVGICIFKKIAGLFSSVRLRNVIDKMGIEVEYEIYNPTLVKIEILKLERRLDENLLYLRDAPPIYSTVPLDMLPVPRDANSQIPLNDLKVEMNPRPWSVDWHHHNYRGISESGWATEDGWKLAHIQDSRTQIERFDLMKIYRSRGPLKAKNEAMRHVEIMHHDLIKYHEMQYKQVLSEMKNKANIK